MNGDLCFTRRVRREGMAAIEGPFVPGALESLGHPIAPTRFSERPVPGVA